MRKEIDVIVLGLSPTGLYAVREAAGAGYRVLGVGAPGALGLWSRFLEDSITHPTPEARVVAIIERFPIGSAFKPVLFVTSDQDLEAVISRNSELKDRVHLQGSCLDGLAARIMDKASFYKLCEVNSVSYPKLWAASVDDATAYSKKITYPCMIKPARIQDVKHLMSGKKGWILHDQSKFDQTLSIIPVEAGTLLMQEIVPGPESNIMLWCGFIDSAGHVRQRFTARKLRQYPAGFGSASLVQSEVCNETSEVAERLLKKIGYQGIAAAEFKRHPVTGELKIIEINPRPSLWFSVTTAAGVPLIKTAIADATGTALPPLARQRDGVRWQYGIKDFSSKLFYWRQPRFVLPAPNVNSSGPQKERANVVWSLNDPMPALAEIVAFARKGAVRVRAKLTTRT